MIRCATAHLSCTFVTVSKSPAAAVLRLLPDLPRLPLEKWAGRGGMKGREDLRNERSDDSLFYSLNFRTSTAARLLVGYTPESGRDIREAIDELCNGHD